MDNNRQPWQFPALSKEESEAVISRAGLTDGRFLVRDRVGHAGDYVLTVVYRGRPTHHLISRGADGNLTVNNKKLGTQDCKSIIEVVNMMQAPTLPTGWPVRLTDFVPGPHKKGGLNEADEDAAASGTGGISSTNSNNNTLRSPPPPSSLPQVEPPAPPPTIVVAAAPPPDLPPHRTAGHHEVPVAGAGAASGVDRRDSGSESPVPPAPPRGIRAAVAPEPQADDPPPAIPPRIAPPLAVTPPPPVAAAPPASPARAGGMDGENLPFMHNEMTKTEADALLTSKAQGDGSFFIRPRGAGFTNEYVLSVMYKSRPSHHLVRKAPNTDFFTVNNKMVVPGKPHTVAEVIEGLHSLQPEWPIPLTFAVNREGPLRIPHAAAAAAPAPAPAPAPAAPVVVVNAEADAGAPAADREAQVAAEEQARQRKAEEARRQEDERRRQQAAAEARRKQEEEEKERQRLAENEEEERQREREANERAAQEKRQREEARRAEEERLQKQKTEEEARRAAAARQSEQQAREAQEREAAARARAEREREEQAKQREEAQRREQQRLAEEQRRRREEAESKARQEAGGAAAAGAAAGAAPIPAALRGSPERGGEHRDSPRTHARNEEERPRLASSHSTAGIAMLSARSLTGNSADLVRATGKPAGREGDHDSVAPAPPPVRNPAAGAQSSRPLPLAPGGRVDKGEGENHNVAFRRPHPTVSFGFALASLWTIDGRRNVVSWVDPSGPAAAHLQMEDEIIGLNGEAVDQLSLEELKTRVRRCENDFKGVIRRRPRHAQLNGSNGLGLAPRTTPAVSRNCCGGLWCQCRECKKAALKEEERLTRATIRMATKLGGKGRISVVLGHRSGESHDDPTYLSII